MDHNGDVPGSKDFFSTLTELRMISGKRRHGRLTTHTTPWRRRSSLPGTGRETRARSGSTGRVGVSTLLADYWLATWGIAVGLVIGCLLVGLSLLLGLSSR